MEEKKMKILVAVDGSENSKRAIIEAKKYGEFFNGKITLLTVLKPIVPGHYSYLEPPKPDDFDRLEKEGEAILTESLSVFGYSTENINTVIRKGNPADEILQEAEKGQYDLIIMGSRGLGVFSRSFLGSVSNQVLNHTHTNVLIIK